MKNKGRRHKAGYNSDMHGIANCKSYLVAFTRPVESMASRDFVKGKFDKRKWQKRIRGYWKSQTKDI